VPGLFLCSMRTTPWMEEVERSRMPEPRSGLLPSSQAARTNFPTYGAPLGRDQRLLAGGSAPAPWVDFFCSAKRNRRKKRPPRVVARFAGSLAPSLPPGVRIRDFHVTDAHRRFPSRRPSGPASATLVARLDPRGSKTPQPPPRTHQP
jgi:hypothetical protein